jgi:aromatic-L-amino-acid/L-tryptophan decarboxylase
MDAEHDQAEIAQRPPPGWDWPRGELEALLARAAGLAAAYLAELPDEPAFRPFPADLREELATAEAPHDGLPLDELLAEVERLVLPYPFGQGHPRFHAYVNPPPSPVAVAAEAIAAAMNSSCAGGNHAATYLELALVRWFAELLGMPDGTAGQLVSGGSAATLTALAVARHAGARRDVRARGLQQDAGALVVYASPDVHAATRKAVELLGIGSDHLRTVDHDERRRMRPDALAAAIEDDHARGLRPLAVVASAGTTATGAIDPLDEIAVVCERIGVWLHVDAAYGGPAVLSRRYRDELVPLGRAASVALDPHKWLYVPIEAGLVLVRDAAAMRACFSLVPSYLPQGEEGDPIGGPPWFSEYGIQQTRGFRALKVWMALRHHGLRGYAEAIEHDLTLADLLAQRVEAEPQLELLARGLSVVCFRHLPDPRPDAGQLDTWNRTLLRRVQLGGRAFISGVDLGPGAFALRACMLNPRSRPADMDALVEAVLAAAHAQR